MDVSTILANDGVSINSTLLTDAIRQYGVGSYLNSPFSGGPVNGKSGLTPTEWIAFINQIQSINMANSNNSIPIIYGTREINQPTLPTLPTLIECNNLWHMSD
jgi:hypothetical protein